MNIKLSSAFLSAAILLTPVVASAAEAGADQPHPVTYVKDSVITTKIKAKLAEQKIKSLLDISVDTDANGEVVLSGTAKSRADADKAASIAGGTEGVTSVKNEIKIKKGD